MQSRRHDDYVTLSPKMHNQHRYGVVGGGGHERYTISRRSDIVDRSPLVNHRRSLSPHRHSKIDGSRRMLMREGRSGSTERRDYSWHLGGGRTDKVRSGSPPFVPERRRPPHYDECIVHRKYDYNDSMDYDDGRNSRLKNAYGYDHHGASSRMNKENDYQENRILGIDGHVMTGQKSMPMDDGIGRVSHRVPPDFIPPSNYGKTGEHHLQLPSRHLDNGQFEREKLRYQEPIAPDKIPATEFYKEGGKPIFLSRDDAYTVKPASHSKGYGSTHFHDSAGTSSGVSRSEFLSSYREGMPCSTTDDYPRNNMKLSEPMDYNTYGQRPSSNIRNLETGKRIATNYSQGNYSPNRTEHDDFLYSKSHRLVNEDGFYPSAGLPKVVPSRSRLDYDQDEADYEYGEISRRGILHPVAEKVDPTVDPYKSLRNSTAWGHTIHKQAAVENLETSRISYAPKNGEEYVGSGHTQLEFGRRESRDDGSSHLGPQNHKISHLRSDYGFGRDAGPQFRKERLQASILPDYDLEMHKFGKRPRLEEEYALYEHSDKLPKRKYPQEDSINRRETRTIIGKHYAPHEYKAAYDSGEEWIGEDADVLHPSRTQKFDQNAYRKAKRTYDVQDHHGDFRSEEWPSSQDSLVHTRKHAARYNKSSVKYTKSHSRTVPSTFYHPHQVDKRVGPHRKLKTVKRNDEDDEDDYANDDNPSEGLLNMIDSELSEDSDNFKQLVHEAFLEYSKKLNLNSAARRRYKEQGKAGSLFCIVCGRSASKEFLDTQRLVTHAFMSHKVGLRPLHLGLHKAISVMMGWNTYVPSDTTTWVPDVLSDSEAWAQKEDLMLWPPLVIIHNISMSNNNPENQKVIPIEGVEAFLRGKGFVGGKIKVCLGKPADQSVMLVKLLGTFTGLGIAQRLDKYFSENNHGRQEFEKKTCNGVNILEEDIPGNNLEEHLLYGYIGVADDLARLDFNTKKWITLKSKKDIQDLENAPVKTDDR